MGMEPFRANISKLVIVEILKITKNMVKAYRKLLSLFIKEIFSMIRNRKDY